MPILPVIDVIKGQVVRGVGGRRELYRPIVSRLTESTDPLVVAMALRAHFGFDELYVADLDAIMGGAPSSAVLGALQREHFRLWVDAGIRGVEDAKKVRQAGVAVLVAGLETLAGPEVLEKLCREHGRERVVFSLDLRTGVSLGKAEAWSEREPGEIARRAVAAGVERLLVLDLARVGAGTGTGTEDLCAQLATDYPHLRLAAGGGIGGMEDVRRLTACGVQTVLVASALHDGRITQI
jgi:phosphoribosylformimino-5-aminoimidazole carboxamide ribotide isomerase